MTRMRCAAVLLAATFAVSACASAVSGRGTVAADRSGGGTFPAGSTSTPAGTTGSGSFPSTAPATSAGTATAGSPTTGTATGGAAAAGALTAAQVAARIEPPPGGATAWSTAWARTRHPSVTAFVQHVYQKQFVADEVSRLRQEEVQDITHQTWYARDADQVDLVLLRFASGDGAIDRFVGVTAAKARTAGIKSFDVSSDPYAVGFYSAKTDSLGNILAIVYARVQNVVIEEFYFSPHTLRKADAVTWMRVQLHRLAA